MEGDLNTWLLVFVRAGAFLSILPIFTMLNIPVQVRVAFAGFLAVLVAPTLPPFPFHHLAVLDWVGLFAKETICGLVIGFVTRMVFFVADFAGLLISNEMGLNMASVVDPVNAHPTQVPALLMFLLTCIMMMTLDMHHWLLTGFQYTYTLAPIGGARLQEPLHPGTYQPGLPRRPANRRAAHRGFISLDAPAGILGTPGTTDEYLRRELRHTHRLWSQRARSDAGDLRPALAQLPAPSAR